MRACPIVPQQTPPPPCALSRQPALGSGVEGVMAKSGLIPAREAVKVLRGVGIGVEATYALARKHGVRIGNRLYLPRALVEGLVEGDLEAIRVIREEGAK